MNRAFRKPNELKIGSSILTRRGGTDANAPESPQETILRHWHVGMLGPKFLGILENVQTKIKQIYEMCPKHVKIQWNGLTMSGEGATSCCVPFPRAAGPYPPEKYLKKLRKSPREPEGNYFVLFRAVFGPKLA